MSLFDRIIAGFGLQKRQLEASSSSRRWPDNNAITSVNSTNLSATLAGRKALYSVLNNSVAARAVAVWTSNLVGDGILPRSSHDSARIRERLAVSFANWTEKADIRGQRDFYGLQADAASCLVTHGECFAIQKFVRNADNSLELRIQLIHPDQVPRSESRDLPNGHIVRQGIELNRNEQIVAYYVLDHRPDDLRAPTSLKPRRIPARQVAHIFRPVEPGQLRGISWFAPVLLMMHELDQLSDATLVKQKLAAMYAGILTDPDGTGSPIADDNYDIPMLESGTVVSMPPGKHLEFTNPPAAADFPPIAKYYLQQIAAGLGLGYDQLSGDLEKVNFSSIRAGTIEFRRMVSQVQHQILIRNFCQPVWAWWIDFQILSGRLSAGQRDAYLKVKWLPPKFAYVDPLKDAKADETLYLNRFKSRTEIVAERGYDVEEVDAELAADAEREERLGISTSANTDEAAPINSENETQDEDA